MTTRRWVAAGAVLLALTGCGSVSGGGAEQATPAAADPREPGVGAPDAGREETPWQSGVWLGGATSAAEVEAFARWRGARVDTLTTYPAYATWDELRSSDWHVLTFEGFPGRLAYGLPLLPSDEPATLSEVADGTRDDVWRSVASHLLASGRDDSYVRVGLEANGTWFPWGATAETADDYRAAYRRVVEVMRESAPELQFVFDISCGVALAGGDDRLDSLTRLYPGDDVVDVIGCDHYDSYSAVARSRVQWQDAREPTTGPGLTDVARFARERGKQLAVPEWGLTGPQSDGGGDNAFFIRKMRGFFMANRDVLAFENYFDEPDDYLRSALFLAPQNPRAAATYRDLW